MEPLERGRLYPADRQAIRPDRILGLQFAILTDSVRQDPVPPSEPSQGEGAPELSVVMPVYNEEGAIAEVVREWLHELESLRIDHELRIYDDGSRDRTSTILEALAATEPRITLIRQTNRGHGPTILRGYREARSAWIFQTDSDGEMDLSGLSGLWARRQEYDFLLGSRQGRSAPPARWLITRVSRWSVRVLYGKGIGDVNTPFRLMRRQCLQDLLRDLPDDLFAPNVILSGLAVRSGLRIYETPVRWLERRQGEASLVGLKAFRPAMRSIIQTASVARRARRSSNR